MSTTPTTTTTFTTTLEQRQANWRAAHDGMYVDDGNVYASPNEADLVAPQFTVEQTLWVKGPWQKRKQQVTITDVRIQYHEDIAMYMRQYEVQRGKKRQWIAEHPLVTMVEYASR